MSARSRRITAVFSKRLLAAGAAARFGIAPAAVRRAAVARNLRLSFEELGPTWMKIGQMFSVRPDVFPAEFVFELEKLQDSGPPMSSAAVRGVIAHDLGASAEELFSTFDDAPLASASIAQVHRATLSAPATPTWGQPLGAGADVVVKVVRPDAESSIVADLREAGRLIERLSGLGFLRHVNAQALLEEFAASLHRELDLRIEGRVADRFAFDFRDDDRIVVPRIVWGRTTRSVLTMEYVEGWRLSELSAADLAGVDARGLAVHGAQAFMRQVLVHGRYHADLHPANIFVTPDERIAYLDFGIVGHLTPGDRQNIAQVLAALVYRDPDRALRYSEGLGVRVPAAKLAAVRSDLSALLAGQGGIDVRHFGMGFLSMLGRHGIDIPVGYGLLVKSLVTVEGVARALYPDIDIVETARPFVTAQLARAAMRPERIAERAPAAVRAALRELLA